MRIFNSIISCLLIICFAGCVDTVDGTVDVNVSGSDVVSDAQDAAPSPDVGTDVETATPDTPDASTEADSQKDVAVVDPETGDAPAGDGSKAEE